MRPLDRFIRQKEAFRRQQAALPIEEKIKVLVRMQRRRNEILRATGRPEQPVWTYFTEEELADG